MNKHIEEAIKNLKVIDEWNIPHPNANLFALQSIASSLIAIAEMMEEQNKPIISEAKSSDYGAMSVPCNKKDNL